jgi:hypothetical protein
MTNLLNGLLPSGARSVSLTHCPECRNFLRQTGAASDLVILSAAFAVQTNERQSEPAPFCEQWMNNFRANVVFEFTLFASFGRRRTAAITLWLICASHTSSAYRISFSTFPSQNGMSVRPGSKTENAFRTSKWSWHTWTTSKARFYSLTHKFGPSDIRMALGQNCATEYFCWVLKSRNARSRTLQTFRNKTMFRNGVVFTQKRRFSKCYYIS